MTAPGQEGGAADGAGGGAGVWRVASPIVAEVGESPVWSATERVLHWVDIDGRRILSTDLLGATSWVAAPEPVGAIVRGSRGLIAALRSGIFRLPAGGGALQRLSAPDDLPREHRFNDATTDSLGALLVGTLSLGAPGEPSGRLYHLGQAGRWTRLLDGFRTINGLAVTPDGRRLYVSDSHPAEAAIWACDYDPEGPYVTRRELFARLGPDLGRPDGAALDTEGNYWTAGNDGWAIHGFRPDGARLRSIGVPVQKPSKPAFGGADLRTLFVTSIARGASASSPADPAGALLAMEQAVVGAPAVEFLDPF